MATNSITRRTLALGAAAALALPFGARAQGATTRLIVAFPPGGPVDFVARTIAEALGKELGQQVIVENKAGANGAIAAEYVSRAAPDASTLWLTSVGAVAINPALYDKLPYDVERDLVPVSLVVNNVEVLVVGANAPYNTGAEFVAAARQPGAKLTLASSGTGSVPHLAMELLNDAAKLNVLHVPYKGAAPAITDVIAGHVNGFFGDIPGLIGHIKSGKLKAIGIAAPQRHPLLPQVRTFDEMGVAGVDSDNWYALFTSKGTPADAAGRVAAALRKALASETVKARLQDSGAQPAASTPAELAALLKKDTAKWTRVVKTKGIKAD
ncbi:MULTISPECIES: Bug family tripartite tricarboxylate transporter substrate binding protein [Ramlibacter]|uniref:Tripartite tricarboxylate transporter substrate binding protein n=1 Tax=Ramlibacter pinisoli TaxID=2682844 RepID=A0A6N8ITW7_9BURK|nr:MULTISPECIES: tripartite tricarboxylate transporter substrate-binding protein [Ramlibacter]MBA2964387.1 tripartite tricarboxylate transporter substrate binding protein [Ramlibacter sp. CGMCC 1.13660]MVQ29353.1 tripartite tricarboxylate transporter substrate binding protein [Ramlibacter pinisoli]